MDKENNLYFLNNDVILKIEKNNIILRKGIFNFTRLNIREGNGITTEDFNKIINYSIKLKNNKKIIINKNDLNILNLFEKLRKYNFVYKKNIEFYPDYLITNLDDNNFFENRESLKNAKIINFKNYNNLNKIKRKNIIVVIDNFDSFLINKINKINVENKNNCIYLLKDGDFSHCVFVNSNYGGCFECFLIRVISRIEIWNEFSKDFKNNKSIIPTNISNNLISLNLLLSILDSIIYNSINHSSILADSKIFSFYERTFEVHIDDLLQIPFCETCGYKSKLQSKEMNISTTRAIQEMLKDELK